jgi:D-tyrosyl-tRNA(Tyr) deacylase
VIGLLQRVSSAHVCVVGEAVGAIGCGLLVLVCAERGDDEESAGRLLERLLNYRVFPDAQGKMNLSLLDINGGLLLVPQFTLAADTDCGNRPGFSPAAPPGEGRRLFEFMVSRATGMHPGTASGRFGADMQVSLTNDGPVTFWLRVPPGSVKPVSI